MRKEGSGKIDGRRTKYLQIKARENATGREASRRSLVYILHSFSSFSCRLKAKFGNQIPSCCVPALLHPLVSDEFTYPSTLTSKKRNDTVLFSQLLSYQFPEMG
uniref:Uncharacterized protein n=1 Tax=Micrurus lemniscatus lemniscatus TaxID=129467 RepID=A0A2D4H866_MICLE